MPIQINEVDTEVEVDAPELAPPAARNQPPADALPRWQVLARRDAQLAERTAAWNFDD